MTTANTADGIRPGSAWRDGWPELGVHRVLVVRLSGELDEDRGSDVAERVAQALAEGPDAVVLDLADVDFVGSAALSVLVDARRRADAGGVTMGLVATRRITLLPLELTGLARVFPVFPTVGAALAEFGGKGADALSA